MINQSASQSVSQSADHSCRPSVKAWPESTSNRRPRSGQTRMQSLNSPIRLDGKNTSKKRKISIEKEKQQERRNRDCKSRIGKDGPRQSATSTTTTTMTATVTVAATATTSPTRDPPVRLRQQQQQQKQKSQPRLSKDARAERWNMWDSKLVPAGFAPCSLRTCHDDSFGRREKRKQKNK